MTVGKEKKISFFYKSFYNESSCAPLKYISSLQFLITDTAVSTTLLVKFESDDVRTLQQPDPDDIRTLKIFGPEDVRTLKGIEAEDVRTLKAFEPSNVKILKEIDPNDIRTLDNFERDNNFY